MPSYKVETMEKWIRLSTWLRKNKFRAWQYQYSWSAPEGLHVWFWLADKEQVEIITHSKDVTKEILLYNEYNKSPG